MLGGPTDETEGRINCSFCGIMEPSEEHLSTHNAHSCGQGVLGRFSCKRRADLVRHLKKSHNVLENGEAVADKWKETTKKQAWSCGFCICLFHTFGDRLKHVAKHFENGQTLDQWNINNVIEGLLSQPGMLHFWNPLSDWKFSEIVFRKDVVNQLQHDLELGPSSPTHAIDLVNAVYNARQSDWHLLKNDRSSQLIEPAEVLLNGVPALDGDQMVSYDYDNDRPPLSFSDENSSSINDSWRPDPSQTLSSTAGPYFSHRVDQENSNAIDGQETWMEPEMWSDDTNANDMLV